MLYRTYFSVTGTLPFPLDMLRYDSCWPQGPEDVANIEDSLARDTDGKQVVVNLLTWHVGKDPRITTGRWSSFSWGVNPKMMTEKV